ncbi:hypothetical protein [Sphingomonas sp. IW22]|jgi:hypothetical protein|uniref:hypothetical protein n=1 Tax=Sphingomonas sp. IW22 TaxID=3242489 RepID=UPI0035221BEC
MRALLIASAALACAGCAADAQRTADIRERGAREFAEATKDRVAGAPNDCISLQRTGGPQIVSPDTLIYRDGSTLWVTRVQGCTFLDDNDLVVSRVFGSQLCRNDQFRTLQRGTSSIPGPICRYGNFTPYRRQTG